MSTLFRFALLLFPRPLLIRVSQWLYPLLDLWYRGKGFTDQSMENPIVSFYPMATKNNGQMCWSPGTLSLERHRLLWLYFKRETDFFDRAADVLHIAPEQAFIKRFRQLNHRSYITSDLHSPIADVQADICNLPFSDQQFDWVVCNHVLEHISNDKIAMQEIYRVLKPGGTAILQVPLRLDQDTFEDDRITDPKSAPKFLDNMITFESMGKIIKTDLSKLALQ